MPLRGRSGPQRPGPRGRAPRGRLDALLVLRLRDAALTLYDVVAPRIPPLAAILARAGSPVRTIEFAFTPERFDVEGIVATPWPEDVFMVRGPWPEVCGPFRFPQLATC